MKTDLIDNLRIIGLLEHHDKRKNLDIILQEIIQENCPDILEQEGKVEIERIHRSPPTFNPQLTTPRNIISQIQKLPDQGKKYYKLSRRRHSDISGLQSE